MFTHFNILIYVILNSSGKMGGWFNCIVCWMLRNENKIRKTRIFILTLLFGIRKIYISQ